jgi:hypothetical protein
MHDLSAIHCGDVVCDLSAEVQMLPGGQEGHASSRRIADISISGGRMEQPTRKTMHLPQ